MDRFIISTYTGMTLTPTAVPLATLDRPSMETKESLLQPLLSTRSDQIIESIRMHALGASRDLTSPILPQDFCFNVKSSLSE